MADRYKLTEEERKSIVLNTWTENRVWQDGTDKRSDRFFIFDCNNGVLKKEFNEKLVDFLQDAVRNFNQDDKEKVPKLEAENKQLEERANITTEELKDFLSDLTSTKIALGHANVAIRREQKENKQLKEKLEKIEKIEELIEISNEDELLEFFCTIKQKILGVKS